MSNIYFLLYRMIMRLVLAILGICIGLRQVSYAAYQQQGFSQFTENGTTIQFSCPSQCVILLDQIGSKALLSFKGNINGQGVLMYWFLVNNQVVPGEQVSVAGPMQLDQQWTVSSHPYFSQIPKDAQLVLLVQWSIQGSIDGLRFARMSMGQAWGQARKAFWTKEPLTVYSINLRRWVNVFGWSLTTWMYVIFLIGAVYMLFTKKATRQNILLLAVGVFLFLGYRNFIDYATITRNGLESYTRKKWADKKFANLDDFYYVLDQSRKIIDKTHPLNTSQTSCKLYMECFQDRPFCVHAYRLFLKPCQKVDTIEQADFVFLYKKEIPAQFSALPKLFEYNGSFLLANQK